TGRRGSTVSGVSMPSRRTSSIRPPAPSTMMVSPSTARTTVPRVNGCAGPPARCHQPAATTTTTARPARMRSRRVTGTTVRPAALMCQSRRVPDLCRICKTGRVPADPVPTLESPPMKLLHIADIHLDRVFHRAESRPAAVRRRGELRDALTRALALGKEREVDAVCIAGDVYEHEYVSEDTISFLRGAFAAAGVPVLVTPGNHDPYL